MRAPVQLFPSGDIRGGAGGALRRGHQHQFDGGQNAGRFERGHHRCGGHRRLGVDDHQHAVGLTQAAQGPGIGLAIADVDQVVILLLEAVEPFDQRAVIGVAKRRASAEVTIHARGVQQLRVVFARQGLRNSAGQRQGVDARGRRDYRHRATAAQQLALGDALVLAQPVDQYARHGHQRRRVRQQKCQQIVAADADQQAVADRVNVRGARLAGDQADFADGLESRGIAQKRAVRQHHLEPAGGDDVHRVGLIAGGEQLRTAAQFVRRGVASEAVERLRRQLREQRAFSEDGAEVHRPKFSRSA